MSVQPKTTYRVVINMLARYEQNGLEFHINQETGEIFASTNAIARMIDKQRIYVLNHATALFEGGTNFTSFEAETLTPGGLQGGTQFT